MKVILLLSSWSSGSTAVAGFLDKCGFHSCPPHQPTVDPRTPIAYEPLAYRQALARCIDEFTLRPKEPAAVFAQFLDAWLPLEMEKANKVASPAIVLKHPLQSFLLREIERACTPVYIVVTRPLHDIERTRRRRRWHKVYGAAGARTIYGAIYSFLQEHNKTYLAVPYERFCRDQGLQEAMLAHCGVTPDPENLRSARAWLRGV